MMKNSNKVIVMGSSNTDMVIQSGHLPKPGETILGGRFEMVNGGKGANQAVAAARLGASTTFIGKMGNDVFAQQALKGLQEDGIDTEFTSIKEGSASGIALIMVDEAGENCISVASGANAEISKEDIDEASASFETGNILLTQLEVPVDIVHFTIQKAKKAGMSNILNPAPAAALPDEMLSQVDIITPNQSEAELLTGVNVTDLLSAKKAASFLRDKGINTIILTMGKQGAYVLGEGMDEIIPALDVVAKDTTAAGDTFNGALACSLAANNDLRSAVEFATKAAAISVTRFGAQPSCPSLDDVLTFNS
ncbi:MAG: ribokinase [Cytophagales bacterium]|nr:ribokinase [Cytophagales bacterium]